MASTTPLAAQSCIASSHSSVAKRRRSPSTWKCRAFTVRAAASEDGGGASTVTDNKREPSKLEKGNGDATVLAKDPVKKAKDKAMQQMPESSRFEDPRWKNGTWDLSRFVKGGKTDWDAVIDAEVLRRKWLEQNPEASSNDEPVKFDTATIPWWAWVKRFHLPEAELLNGRAAMLGFVAAYFIDALTGVGLVDQTSSFFGKLLLFVTVIGVLLIRKNEDLSTLKSLVKESTFYDKQWQATWIEEESTNKPEDTT